MTVPTLQIVDSDESTVLFDLNDPTGANNPGGVRTWLERDLALGVPDTELAFFNPATGPGGFVVFAREPLVTSSCRVAIERPDAGDWPDVVAGANELSRLLRAGGIVRWVEPEGAEKFLDYEPSPAVALYRGQDVGLESQLRRAVVPVVFHRQPLVRSAEQTIVNADSLQNNPIVDPTGQTVDVANPGTAPMPVEVRVTPDADAIARQLIGVYEGSATERADYQGFTRAVKLDATARGWTVALFNDTAVATDSDGDHARTSFVPASGANVIKKRIRVSRTTRLDSLRGRTFEVRLRFLGEASKSHTVTGYWGPSTADPPQYPLDTVTLDLSAAGSAAVSMVPLGRITIPEDDSWGGLAIEIWTSISSATPDGTQRFYMIDLFPVSAQVAVEVPAGTPQEWAPTSLVTPVTSPSGGTAAALSNGAQLLDHTTDNIGTPTNSGIILPSGRQRAAARLQALAGGSVKLRVRNVTQGTNLVERTNIAPNPANAVREYAVDYTLPVSGHALTDLYQIQVDDPTVASSIAVHGMSQEVLPLVLSGQRLVANDEGDAYRADASGLLLTDYAVAGALPLIVPPGDSLVCFSWENAPVDAGHQLGRHAQALNGTVTLVGAPRDWQ